MKDAFSPTPTDVASGPAAAVPQASPANPKTSVAAKASSGAVFVAAGILLSRLVGLLRERIFAHYLGNSVAAAAFKAAQRVPNLLQNLFGEGVLSASFIPVYASLLAKEEQLESERVAGAVFGILALVSSVLVALGVWATPVLIDVIAPGFHGEARELSISLVRILFPSTGLLVMSAWCLGILNSHHRFFLSYAAPVISNLTLCAALLFFGNRRDPFSLVTAVAWAMVAGSALQVLTQLPTVLRLLGAFRPSLDIRHGEVTRVLHNFAPAVLGRGVVQISAYIDLAISSLLGVRAVAALSYAQTLYLLPVSLFGMSISAAELPRMAADSVSGQVEEKLRARIGSALSRISFFVVPSAAALLFLGDLAGATLFQTGRFTAQESRYLWYVLAGSSVGLLASTQGRLYASCFYALKDTRTPFYFALIRVTAVAILGYASAVPLPRLLGLPEHLGAVGLTVSSGLASWVEFFLLRRSLTARLGPVGFPARQLGKLWVAALLASGAALALKGFWVRALGPSASAMAEVGGGFFPAPSGHPVFVGLTVLLGFGLLYLGIAAAAGVSEARALFRKIASRFA